MRGKQRVFVVEEGMPNYIERELKALAHEARLGVEIQGKELLSPHGEYVPHLVIGGLRRFLTSAGVKSQSAVAIEDRYRALTAHREKVGDVLPEPVAKRPPSFCTGCPERPVFSALKILRQREPEIGDTHVAADIGCSTFSTQAPFNVGNSVLGYGMGLASSSAVSPLFGKRTISVMGDGGFWHNGLTNGVANAMYNRQDSVLVILDNFYAAATGQHHVPSTGKNARNEPLPMTIPDALRGLGVKWIRTVNSYRIAEVIGTMRDALTTRVPGLKVVIARNECMLERQRRERPKLRKLAAAGHQVVQPRFGVDPDVCTGDHSCMRLNGCPSLTLRDNPDPLREDPIAHVDDTCVGCGVCGEVAHAAVLCPSFYEAKVITNPSWWTRFVSRLRAAVIRRLATAGTHRLYSIHEKIVTGRGIYPIEKLQAAARAFSKRLIAFDALALAREHGTEANAVLLGALAGSGVLPLSAEAFREAIRTKAVQVEGNLRGFEAGLAVAAGAAAVAGG